MMIVALAAACAITSGLQVGTTWGGEETVRYLNAGEGIDETHKFSLHFRVTGQQEGLWLVERKAKLLESRYGDDILKADEKDRPATAHLWLGLEGQLAYIEPFDTGQIRLDRLLHFWLSSNTPARWSVKIQPTGKQFVTKAEASFTLMATENDSSTRVYDFSYRETDVPFDMTATGRIRFDGKSGRILSEQVDVKNGAIPGGTDHVSVTLTYRDDQPSKPGDARS